MTSAASQPIEAQPLDDGVLLVLKGDIDFDCSPQVRQAMQKALVNQPRRLVMDLSSVTYMDSSGLATFIEAVGLMRAYQGKFILAGVGPRVMSIFEIARLQKLFIFADDVEKARSA